MTIDSMPSPCTPGIDRETGAPTPSLRQRMATLEVEHIYRKLTKTRYVYIGVSDSCDLAIFSAKALTKGHVIVEDDDGDYNDGWVTEAQVRAMSLSLSVQRFQIDENRYLLPHGSIDDLINHSCDPNSGIRLTSRGYRLLALRDICAGEELTYDYSTYISNPRERLECRCGSVKCRRDIGPFRELPLQVRAFYLAHDVVGAFAVADASLPVNRR